MSESSLAKIASAIQDKFSIECLTDNQMKALVALREKRDIFVCTKTGSGKSLSYESVPVVFEDACVLIIAPLTSIMKEQCEKLNALGFTATYIGRDKGEDEKIKDGCFDFVFSSPESIVGDKKWRDILGGSTFAEKLKLITVDEAHTVLQWGEGSTDRDDPFREWFSKIGELRSLCMQVPIMALTATASPMSRKKIMKNLNFRPSPEIILDCADRSNIKISTQSLSSALSLQDTFQWLISGLEQEKQCFPRHIIFCATINDCARIYCIFVRHFGRHCELFNMYHSKTTDVVKEEIRGNMMNDDGTLRILICTNAAGMGVNFHNVNNIVHYGLPREMDTFVQQMGRAGRDGAFAHELIILKSNKLHFKRIEPDLLKLARDKDICRHKVLCEAYLSKHTQIHPKHNCCDVCEKVCDCEEDNCPEKHSFFSDNLEEDQCGEEAQFIRSVTDAEKDLLRQQLKALKLKMDMSLTSSCFDTTSVYGISDSMINDVVVHSDSLFTPMDVMNSVTCWSFSIAEQIVNVLNAVFGDGEMYNLPELSEDELSEISE